jgi:hypothetical protein
MMLPGGGAPAHEMDSSHLLTCPTSLIRMQLGKAEVSSMPPLDLSPSGKALTDTGSRGIMSGLATYIQGPNFYLKSPFYGNADGRHRSLHR